MTDHIGVASTPTTTTHTRRARQRDRSRAHSRWLMSIALLILPLTVYGAFMLYPIGRVVVLSFYEWDGLGVGT